MSSFVVVHKQKIIEFRRSLDACRTWDFLLLAKSRLERLGDSVDWASDDDQDDEKSSDTGYDVKPSGYGDNMAAVDLTSGYGKTNDAG